MIKPILGLCAILAMLSLRRRLTLLLAVSIFFFSMPVNLIVRVFGLDYARAADLLTFLRWPLYLGFVVLGVIYNHKRQLRKFIIPDIFICSFLLLLPFSVMISINPQLTLLRGVSVGLLYLVCFFGIYSYVDNLDKIYRITNAIFIALLTIDILGCLPGIGLIFAGGRLGGLSNYPTGTAGVNAFIFPFVLLNYAIKRRKIDLFFIFFVAAFTYFTYTRAAVITILLSSVLFYAQYFRRQKIVFAFLAFLILATIFISFFIFGIWLPHKLVRVQSLPILGGRLEAWAVAREIVFKSPLYGFGFGTEELLFEQFGIKLKVHFGKYFHNSFLGLAAQIGVPFALLFFSAIVFFTVSMSNFVKRISNQHYYYVGIAFIAVLFTGFVYCFIESWIYSAGNLLCFIYFIVFTLCIRLRSLTILEQNKGLG